MQSTICDNKKTSTKLKKMLTSKKERKNFAGCTLPRRRERVGEQIVGSGPQQDAIGPRALA